MVSAEAQVFEISLFHVTPSLKVQRGLAHVACSRITGVRAGGILGTPGFLLSTLSDFFYRVFFVGIQILVMPYLQDFKKLRSHNVGF